MSNLNWKCCATKLPSPRDYEMVLARKKDNPSDIKVAKVSQMTNGYGEPLGPTIYGCHPLEAWEYVRIKELGK